MNPPNSSVLFKPTFEQFKDLCETDLSGKIILVLNASFCIASQASILLSSYGAQLILIDSIERQSKMKNVISKCNQSAKYGNKWQYVNGKWLRSQETRSFQYKDMNDIETIVKNIVEIFERIDFILFNPECATYPFCNNITDIESRAFVSELQNQYHRDLLLFTKLIQCSIVALEKSSGSIALLTTTNGLMKTQMSNIITSLLNSSLLMFVRCLALELGPKGIRINCINYFIPQQNNDNIIGLEVNQSMIDQFTEKIVQTSIKQPTSKDISWAVLHLATQKRSQFLNGINLIVDNSSILQ